MPCACAAPTLEKTPITQIAVTLTATSNPALAPDLPARGLLDLFEISADGRDVTAVWRAQKADGSYAAPVVAPDPAFTYVHPGAEVDREAAGVAALVELFESFDDVEDIRSRALDMVRAVLSAADGRVAALSDAAA
ncbi:hypothetical protein [Cellulosimicrobium sp. NPDC057127]|uniref:hypothetical protein n=1 Tax=Cellulosimicrobium sp. NPDC057127 TaxID=3346026 RepID=UPI00363860C3